MSVDSARFTVTRGNPDAEELAAIVAVLSRTTRPGLPAVRPRATRWHAARADHGFLDPRSWRHA